MQNWLPDSLILLFFFKLLLNMGITAVWLVRHLAVCGITEQQDIQVFFVPCGLTLHLSCGLVNAGSKWEESQMFLSWMPCVLLLYLCSKGHWQCCVTTRDIDWAMSQPGTLAVPCHNPGILAMPYHYPGTLAEPCHNQEHWLCCVTPRNIGWAMSQPGTLAVLCHI